MNETKTHNGWTNYETWNAKLWIDNDQGEQEFWNEQAQECFDQSEDGETFTRKEQAALDLMERLKNHYDNNMEELGVPELSGMYADLLNAALSEINWYEIAVSLLKDVEEEEV